MTAPVKGNRPNLQSRLAVSTALAAIVLCGYGGRKVYAGSCVGAAGTYTCSGAANSVTDVTQTINPGVVLTVTTTAGFGIDTSVTGGDALA